MVSKEKRQQYNRRYYSKKSLDKLNALNTIEERSETSEISETSDTSETEVFAVDVNVDDIKHKHEYEPHILMRLSYFMFYIIQWFKR